MHAALTRAVDSGAWSRMSGTDRGVYVALLVSARMVGSALMADVSVDRLLKTAQASRPSVYRALAAIEAAGLGRRDSTAPNSIDLSVGGVVRHEAKPVIWTIGTAPDRVSPVRPQSHPRDSSLTHETQSLTHETDSLTCETPRAESQYQRQNTKNSSSSSSSCELSDEWKAAERSLRDRLGLSHSDARRIVEAAIAQSRVPCLIADAIDTIIHRRKAGPPVGSPARYALAFVRDGYSLQAEVLEARYQHARELVTTGATTIPPGPTSVYAARVWAAFAERLGEAWDGFRGRVAMHTQDGALRFIATEATIADLRSLPGMAQACRDIVLAHKLRETVLDIREVRA
jgi:hypothetical protein